MTIIRVKPGQALTLSPEQELRRMKSDEVGLIEGVPSLDLSEYEKTPGLGTFFGQGFMDSVVQQGIGSMATIQTVYGKLEDDKRGGSEEGFRTKVAKKLRGLELMGRKFLAVEKDKMEVPGTFPEKIARGLGNGVGSLLGMVGGALVGGGVGMAVGGPPVAVAGATVGAFGSSYVGEYANMAQELLDAGYDAKYVDRVSNYYALPVATLDVASFGFLSRMARPLVAPAVKTAIGGAVSRGLKTYVGRAAVAGLAEGSTEMVQGQIQTEFEIANKIQSRDFQEDLTNRAVEGIVGMVIGSQAATVGQLRSRRGAIRELSTKYNIPPKLSAKLVDEAYLRGADAVLSDVIDKADISQDVKWIDKAFAKAQKLPDALSPVERLEEAASAELYSETSPGIGEEAVLAEARAKELLTEAETIEKGNEALKQQITELEAQIVEADPAQQKRLERQLSVAVQNLDVSSYEAQLKKEMAGEVKAQTIKTEGKVMLPASQVRQLARRSLKQVVTAYRSGRKVSETEMKAVQKAFLTSMKGMNLPKKATTRLLRKVLTVRTADQFNQRIGSIMSAVNSVLRTEKVTAYQALGKRIIEKMLSKNKKVAPQAQLFAEHLMNVMRGTAPLNYDYRATDTENISKAITERAVEDLRTASDNASEAQKALEIIDAFYRDNLQAYTDYRARRQGAYNEIIEKISQAVSKGVKLNAFQQALDSVRLGKVKEEGLSGLTFPLPYTKSFMTILDGMDIEQGYPSTKGPLFKAFDSSKPFQAWVVETDRSKVAIDGKLREIYGEKAHEIWKSHMTDNFIDVKLESGEVQNISRSGAMSLYMMTKMPRVREDLINMGISAEWLGDFETGNYFTAKDHAWMENVREILDGYAKSVGAVYEAIVGKPFRAIDNYFMTMRYMYNATEDTSVANDEGTIEALLKGFFERDNVADSDRFKRRKGSEALFKLPDIYAAVSSYAVDMNHFIAYAEYVTRLQNTFQSTKIKKEMAANLPSGISAVIDEHIKHLASGSASRSADRMAMRKWFRLFGYYGRNQLANPKTYFRQMSSISAFTYVKAGKQWIGAKEILEAAADLPRAVRAGELKTLTDTAYMRQRFEGLYDFGIKFVEDMARRDVVTAGKRGVIAKVRGAIASKAMHDLVTMSAKYGDRSASIIGGWAVYRTMLKQTNDPVLSAQTAIQAIEDTQQSLDPGRAPVAFSRGDATARMFTVFMRTQAIYFDMYMRTQKAFTSGQMTKAEYARKMIAFHVWIPLFDYLVTAGVTGADDWEWGEAAIYMAAGPLSYTIFIGQLFQALAARLSEAMFSEEEIPVYMKDVKDRHLVTSFFDEGLAVLDDAAKTFEYPDFDNMWNTMESAGQVGDVSALPTGYLSRVPRGVKELFTDPVMGLKILMGYSPYRTGEREQEEE